MEKIVYKISLIFILSFGIQPNLHSQNYIKEIEYLKSLSSDDKNHVFIDFLNNEFDFKQVIGLGAKSSDYDNYKKNFKLDKNGNILLKKHLFFSSYRYSSNNKEILNEIRFNFNPKNYSVIREKLIKLCGVPDNETYGHVGQSIFFVPEKYYITLSTYSFLEISALDFMENETSFDEFSKLGTIFFNKTPYKRIGSDHIFLNFIFIYDKKDNFKGLGIKTNYKGDDWLFINKAEYLFDNGEVITLDLEPKRKTEMFFGDVNCLENDIILVPESFFEKILSSKSVKIKISGENNHIVIDLSPLHKYQISTALYYLRNFNK